MTSTIARWCGAAAAISMGRAVMRGGSTYDPTHLEWNPGLYSPLALTFALLTVVCVLSGRAAYRPDVTGSVRPPR